MPQVPNLHCLNCYCDYVRHPVTAYSLSHCRSTSAQAAHTTQLIATHTRLPLHSKLCTYHVPIHTLLPTTSHPSPNPHNSLTVPTFTTTSVSILAQGRSRSRFSAAVPAARHTGSATVMATTTDVAKAFSDLFTAEQQQLVLRWTRAGLDVDLVLSVAIEAKWDGGCVAGTLAPLVPDEATPVHSSVRMATISWCGCGRPLGRVKRQCCVLCPSRHTATCDSRRDAVPSELVAHLAQEEEPVKARPGPVAHDSSEGAVIAPVTAAQAAAATAEQGYVVLRAPKGKEQWRGTHRLTWAALWGRMGADPDRDRSGFYVRRSVSDEIDQMHWHKQGLRGSPPCHP